MENHPSAMFKEQLKAVNEKIAADILDVGVQSLRNDRSNHRGMPYVKIGRSVRYLMSDIESYLQSNRIVPSN